jgi:hypothetical protein
MTAIQLEVRMDSVQTTTNGATVVIHNVPTKIHEDMYGNEHVIRSLGVAIRLEELTKRTLEADSTPGVVHHLEF